MRFVNERGLLAGAGHISDKNPIAPKGKSSSCRTGSHGRCTGKYLKYERRNPFKVGIKMPCECKCHLFTLDPNL